MMSEGKRQQGEEEKEEVEEEMCRVARMVVEEEEAAAVVAAAALPGLLLWQIPLTRLQGDCLSEWTMASETLQRASEPPSRQTTWTPDPPHVSLPAQTRRRCLPRQMARDPSHPSRPGVEW